VPFPAVDFLEAVPLLGASLQNISTIHCHCICAIQCTKQCFHPENLAVTFSVLLCRAGYGNPFLAVPNRHNMSNYFIDGAASGYLWIMSLYLFSSYDRLSVQNCWQASTGTPAIVHCCPHDTRCNPSLGIANCTISLPRKCGELQLQFRQVKRSRISLIPTTTINMKSACPTHKFV
jgi:hypothetical protein